MALAQGRACPKGTHPCPGGTCVPEGQACGSAGCPPGQVREGGQCVCPNGFTQLGTTCCPNDQVCGTICCSPGQFCEAGVCVECRSDADCPAGTVCAGNEYLLPPPPPEPGTCFVCNCEGDTPPPGETCDIACCWEENPLAPGSHICVPLNCSVASHRHCGRCGNACPPGQVCLYGACTPCSTDEQCSVSGAGNFCVNGVCHGCRSDADCPPDAVCLPNTYGQGVCTLTA